MKINLKKNLVRIRREKNPNSIIVAINLIKSSLIKLYRNFQTKMIISHLIVKKPIKKFITKLMNHIRNVNSLFYLLQFKLIISFFLFLTKM